jgi:hypothetical protein
VVLLSAPAHGQTRRAMRDPVADIALMTELARAARELLTVVPTPGDANGQLRAWDRRWLATIDRLPEGARYRGGCPLHFDALVVRLRRHALGRNPSGDTDPYTSADDVAWSMAINRWFFEDAARRLRAGLTCEDQPEWHGGRSGAVPILEGCVGAACTPSNEDLLTYSETGRWPPRAADTSPPPAPTSGAPGTGRLSVTAVPSAAVSVNGIAMGDTPLRIDLPAGSHEFELRDPEGHVRRMTVEIRAGETTRIRIEF